LEVLPAENYDKRFPGATSDAVVTVEKSGTKVWVREGAVKTAVIEEAVHVLQAANPKFAPLIALLDEAKLAKWPTMKTAEKLATVHAKLELELDAQKQVIDRLGKSARLSPEDYAQLDSAWQNPEHLRG